MRKPIQIGDTVRLRATTKLFHVPDGREDHPTAKVRAVNLYGVGGLHVDRDLNGLQYWNEDDVAIVKRA